MKTRFHSTRPTPCPIRWAGLPIALAASVLTACAQAPALTPLVPAGTTTVTVTTTAGSSASTPGAVAVSPSSTGTPTASGGSTEASGSCPKTPSAMVNKAPGEGKTVALTFDDGPAEADRAIVEILDRYDVHATFFQTGKNAEALPEISTLIVEHGNLLADHSWEHQYPSAVPGGWTLAYVSGEMKKTKDELESITSTAICYYRPPGGHTTNVLAAASKVGLTPVMWSVDTQDWQQPGTTTAAATAAIVANGTKASGQSHPIVLMHSTKASHEPDSQVSPNRSNTLAALPAIIEWYQEHGYTFVRMDGER